jgi:hypothetical protein
MPMIAVKYAKLDPRTGNLNYRRRVPKALKEFFPGQTMLVKGLGKGAAAHAEYARYDAKIEHYLTLAKAGAAGLSPTEQHKRLKTMLEKWGADPHSPGLDDNERTWREADADKMLAPYQNLHTGEWADVPPDVEVQATALLAGVPKTNPEPTITDAFKFYLAEKAMTIPEKRKKQVQRFGRAEKT